MASAARPRHPTLSKIPGPSLFVGDLDPSVTERQLFNLFSRCGPIQSFRVCRDETRRSSLECAYVTYSNAQEASRALEVLSFTPISGKPITIMFSHQDPGIRKSGYANVRKSGYANVFIKNLDTTTDEAGLYEIFSTFGLVLSIKVATDNSGQSKGYGFVQFSMEEDAQNAIKQLNGMLINNKQVYVGPFVRREERNQTDGTPKFTNVYVQNLSETTTDEDLRKVFSIYGLITSAAIMRDSNGKNRGFGFVNFQNPDDAAAAVESTSHGEKNWYVGMAQKKAEREAELKAKYERDRMEELRGANLYVKNLDHNINDEKLKELFSEFGTVTSCKVKLDSHGQSRGFGFVALSTPEEANRAINEMSGKMIGRKPLYVAVFQRKDERKARLEGPMTPSLCDVFGLPFLPIDAARSQPVAITKLASALASASPEQQRLMLGEQLFLLVDRLEQDSAAKVTWMLLKMDQSELIHLIESPDALKRRVAQAMEIFQFALVTGTNLAEAMKVFQFPQVTGSDVADQLGSLSLSLDD
ncbi:polyadenylate-binding protein 2-like isoform X2 [Magnolia sinica]|uniref:polyadenylate-binding protein 2-like isoform X2 n=1 Tax=Magnolia sinica TaxID=86752 RepID=UPI00265A77ED|nr:polyadenylate-binding protein 2-like isoform X2 [Magnolia sinica]